MMGLQDFIRTVRKVRSRLNERLQIAGILLTMCDARTNLCRVITEQVMEAFDGQIRIFESGSRIQSRWESPFITVRPVGGYAPGSKACEMYRAWQGRWQVMKANSPKRKVFQDALDLLTEDMAVDKAVSENGICKFPLIRLRRFMTIPSGCMRRTPG